MEQSKYEILFKQEFNLNEKKPLLLMVNKYFTPSIEDIRVGYECERKSTGIEKDNNWTPCIMDFYDMQNLIIDNRLDWYRVPHLTKEQIEAEGWKWLSDTTYGGWVGSSFEKDNYLLGVNYIYIIYHS